jgi:ABC-type polysaccharide/polyol phosphate transport system ATPase subunit
MNFNSRPLIEISKLNLQYPFREETSQSVSRDLLSECRRLWRGEERPTHTALNDFNLKVMTGERLGIIGANGSGKTSLLKVISGILAPSSGQVKLAGRVLPLIDVDGGFCSDLTGRENLILMGLLLGESRKSLEARLPALIELAGLNDFADVPTRDYSMGMKGRLGFALISSLKAEILVFDELLATTDASFLKLAGQKLTDLISSAGCALIVSHTMDLIQEVCTRVIWLHQGKIMAEGLPDDVCPKYLAWSRLAPIEVKRISKTPAPLEL